MNVTSANGMHDDPRDEISSYCQIQTGGNILHITSGLICFLANFALLIAITVTKSSRKSTNRLITNLLLCDAILGATFAIRGIQRESATCPELTETQWSCAIRNWHTTVSVMLCLYATLAVTIGRFVAVAFPLWYASRSACLDNALLVVTWLLALLWLVTGFLGLDNERVIRNCRSDVAYNNYYYRFIHYTKPPIFVILVFCYAAMLYLLHRNRRNMESVRSIRQTAAEKNVNFFVTVIVAMYLILWLVPVIVQLTVKKYIGDDKFWRSYIIRTYMMFLNVFTALANAIVFYNRSNYAQSAFHKMSKRMSQKFGSSTRSDSLQSNSSSSNRTRSTSMWSLDSRVLKLMTPRKSFQEVLDVNPVRTPGVNSIRTTPISESTFQLPTPTTNTSNAIQPVFSYPAVMASNDNSIVVSDQIGLNADEDDENVLEKRENGIVENGIVKNGIVENGIVKNGIVENGIVKNGIVENGIVKNGIVENEIVKNGISSGKEHFQAEDDNSDPSSTFQTASLAQQDNSTGETAGKRDNLTGESTAGSQNGSQEKQSAIDNETGDFKTAGLIDKSSSSLTHDPESKVVEDAAGDLH